MANLTVKNIVLALIIIVIAFAAYSVVSKPKYTPTIGSQDNSLGNENATVIVIEYSDFQCSACGAFYASTEKQFIYEYVSTGKVRFVYKHFPLRQIHANAQKAAEASECAAEQNKFWEYRDLLFQNQNSLSVASLKKYASQLGLDRGKFDTCLDSGAMVSRVQEDFEEGLSMDVGATPTFFINDVKLEGARPFSAFKQAIDAELKGSE